MSKTIIKRLSIVVLAVMVFGLFSGFISKTPVRKTYADEIKKVNHDLSVKDITFEKYPNVKVGITIVDETTDLSVKVGPETDEDFYPEHKNWNGIPTVAKAGNNIFVAWYTGGKGEPDTDNYICVAVSTDMGVTWKNPWMVITGSPLGIVWPIFYKNGAGELCLIYGDNKMTGSQMIKLYNADGPLENITYSYPKVTGAKMSVTCKPTLLSDGRILAAYGNNAFDGIPTTIIKSEDDGETFSAYRVIKSTVEDRYHDFAEVSIVEKKDDKLWALIRLCDGMSMEQSFSSDGGNTWTRATNDLANPPFYSPGSRFYMARLKSGNLLFVTNMQGRNTDRRNMTCWLSEDDGETWPYSLQLDPTQSSYPDFYQDDDGLIYMVHDRERYGEGGIRMHIFTEEDVKKGEFCTENAKQGIIIAKIDYSYGDIVSVNGAFEKVEKYKIGTDIKDILKNKPTTITVTDDNGKNYTLTGRYRVSGYDKNKAGTYTAYFTSTEEMPSKLKDGYGALKFRIVLEDSGSGCSSSLNADLFIPMILFGGAAIVSLIKKIFYEIKKFKEGKRENITQR